MFADNLERTQPWEKDHFTDHTGTIRLRVKSEEGHTVAEFNARAGNKGLSILFDVLRAGEIEAWAEEETVIIPAPVEEKPENEEGAEGDEVSEEETVREDVTEIRFHGYAGKKGGLFFRTPTMASYEDALTLGKETAKWLKEN